MANKKSNFPADIPQIKKNYKVILLEHQFLFPNGLVEKKVQCPNQDQKTQVLEKGKETTKARARGHKITKHHSYR